MFSLFCSVHLARALAILLIFINNKVLFSLIFYFQIFDFCLYLFLLLLIFIYLFSCAGSYVQHVGPPNFVVAWGFFNCGMWTLNCSMWVLVPCPGIESKSSALGAWSLSHWTTKEALIYGWFNRKLFLIVLKAGKFKLMVSADLVPGEGPLLG